MDELLGGPVSLGATVVAPLWILSLSALAVAIATLFSGWSGAVISSRRRGGGGLVVHEPLRHPSGTAASTTAAAPRHVAVIMDGNRRYGKARYGDPIRGHADGGVTLGNFAKWCQELGVEVLTVYAFSTENWNREEAEVNSLMENFCKYCYDMVQESRQEGIRVSVLVSNYEKLPSRLLKAIDDVQRATEQCRGLKLNVCVSYGGRGEILSACQQIAQAVADGELSPAAVSEEVFRKHLLTGSSTPDPEVLIRTSGEVRVSNFLLYQLAYTEMFFLEKHWPELDKEDLIDVIERYHQRKRRFGC